MLAHTDPRRPINASPFAELAQMNARLRARHGQPTLAGARMAQLLNSAEQLAEMSDWAAAMQLGADGYDNTAISRRYAAMQDHLRAAAREIVQACRAMAADSDISL